MVLPFLKDSSLYIFLLFMVNVLVSLEFKDLSMKFYGLFSLIYIKIYYIQQFRQDNASMKFLWVLVDSGNAICPFIFELLDNLGILFRSHTYTPQIHPWEMGHAYPISTTYVEEQYMLRNIIDDMK